VEKSIYKEFVARLKQRISHLRVGTEPNSDLCPVSGETALALRSQIEDALARGAALHSPQDPERVGHEPVLLTGVPGNARILTEECFGPVLCVAPFNREDEAVRLANECDFALSSSVWTRNRARARRIAAHLSAGSCAVNDVIRVIANPHAAFGGNRLSGYGRYHGPEGLHAFSRIRTIMLAGDRREKEINWFPFTSRTRQQLAALIQFRHGAAGVASLLSWLLPLLLAAVLCPALSAQPDSQARLTINVRLTSGAHGELAYLVFGSGSGFPGDRHKAIRHGFLPIPAGANAVRIDVQVPAGTYAVSVYEDLNSNHKLDHTFLGIPSEPVGASNNPHPHLGPPRFNECSFRVGPVPQTISINLVRGS
jgi:uncharacterized protein (DUF2141 family)